MTTVTTAPKSSPGGARPGAGRHLTEAHADYARERAEHERVKREQREFKLAVERDLYLPRDAVRQASATALAVLTQALRTLPDNLERKFSLDAEVVEEIAAEVDAALTDLSMAFRAMTPQG